MSNGATSSGTKSFFDKHKSVPTSVLGKTGWSLSPVGFGSYRISDQVPAHGDALKLALRSGCNLIDTSTNYGDGGSERLVGQVLNELTASGEVKREQIVVVTKIGYVQGENLQIAQDRKYRAQPFAEMVEFQPGCWHCISPEFLEDQLTRSLERLKAPSVDVVLLHNPEYFLKHHGTADEYYRRIRSAFLYFEEQADRGRLQYYGISSNTFPDSKDSSTFTSLDRILKIAQEIGPKNRFGVIQFPLNLYETGAALELNNTLRTVLYLANREKIGTLINRPLNAFAPAGLIRLASFPRHENEDVVGNLKKAIEESTQVEAEIPKEWASLGQKLGWGHVLAKNLDHFQSLEDWKMTLEYRIRPSVDEALGKMKSESASTSWISQYTRTSESLFSAVTALLESQMARNSVRLEALLDRLGPAMKSSRTLSQKVIRLYRSLQGANCILVGMRSPAYVKDALQLEPALEPAQSLELLKQVRTEL